MNCQEIKNKLEEKDKQISERNAKTIEYFNLIKDDVVDKLIEDHINDEFKSDFYHVFECDIMNRLYLKLGINKKYIGVRYHLFGTGTYSYWDEDVYFSDILNLNDKEIRDIDNMKKIFIDFKDNLDRDMLMESLADYIVANGFKQYTLQSTKGKMYRYNEFKITRSQLENNCCDTSSGAEFHMISNETEKQPEIEKKFVVKKTLIIWTKEFIQFILTVAFGFVVSLMTLKPDIAHYLALILILICSIIYLLQDKLTN